MRRPLFTVYRKELRDALRDRRTALMIFIASVVTGPVMIEATRIMIAVRRSRSASFSSFR